MPRSLPPPGEGRLLRTLFVSGLDPSRKFGSMEEQILALARHFRDAGSVLLPVFSAPLSEVDRELYEREGLLWRCLDLWSARPRRLGALAAMIREHGIELVSWNFYKPLSTHFIATAALFPRLRHLYTHHDSRVAPFVQRRGRMRAVLKRSLLRRYDRVLAVSGFVEECLRQEGWWPHISRFRHFVNTDRFRPCPAERTRVRRELGLGGDFVVVFVGQLIPEKGISTCLRAWEQMPACAHLLVVGEGPLESEVATAAEREGPGGRVRFLGRQRLVEPLLQAADVVTCPSEWAEAAGLVNLEAAACGVPVVASDIGGIPEFVLDGKTGILVPPGRTEALALAFQRLGQEDATRRRMGEEARRRAEAVFSLAATLDANLAHYRRPYPAPRHRSSAALSRSEW